MSDSATPWTAAHQAPLAMGFSRQEYWSGEVFPSPADLPNPGIEPRSPALWADSLPSEPPWKPKRTQRKRFRVGPQGDLRAEVVLGSRQGVKHEPKTVAPIQRKVATTFGRMKDTQGGH